MVCSIVIFNSNFYRFSFFLDWKIIFFGVLDFSIYICEGKNMAANQKQAMYVSLLLVGSLFLGFFRGNIWRHPFVSCFKARKEAHKNGTHVMSLLYLMPYLIFWSLLCCGGLKNKKIALLLPLFFSSTPIYVGFTR